MPLRPTDEDAEPLCVSVVVPFFDEADNVEPLLAEIDAALKSVTAFEIIAVDDCSRDTTLLKLQEMQRRLPNLRLVAHAENLGQSAALCTGADHARGVWLVTLDGDGQNDPADVPDLLSRIGADDPEMDMICGHRARRMDNWLRRLSSRVANQVRAKLLGDVTPDTGCGLKVIRRTTFARLPRFNHMHRFLPALVQRQGGSVCSVAVSHRPRRHGRSKYGVWNRLWVGIVDLFGVMWLQRRAFKAKIRNLEQT